MKKVLLRSGSSIGLATLVLAAALTAAAQAQLPPDPVDIGLPPAPKPVGLPASPVDIGLPPTPKPVGLPPNPADIGLPRLPAPMGASPAAATVELPPGAKSRTSPGAGARACEPGRLATVKTDTLRDGRIRIPVTVEGRSLSFIVDTGGTNTTIAAQQAKELGLTTERTALELRGVAGSILNSYVASRTFSLGELQIKNLPLYVETRRLAEGEGTLAPDVMRDYDVDIDFARNSLSLICPGQSADPTHAGAIVVPMVVTGDGHVRFPVKIDGRDVMATLDTGSALSFMSMQATASLGIDPKAPELKLVGDTGQYQVFTYPFESLVFGRVLARNPPIVIVSDNFATGLGGDLILGANVLRQMHLYIAYGEKRLYITPAQAN